MIISCIYQQSFADSRPVSFDFSDLPMDEELGIDNWADLPTEKVHEYFERFVDRFDLRRRCRLITKVLGVEKDGEEWKLEVEGSCGQDAQKTSSWCAIS